MRVHIPTSGSDAPNGLTSGRSGAFRRKRPGRATSSYINTVNRSGDFGPRKPGGDGDGKHFGGGAAPRAVT
jgi:hypothetical protein